MIFEKLKKMIAEQLNISESAIKPESRIIKDLHADSLDVVETLMNIEAEWNIEFGDDTDVSELETVQDVVNCIEEMTKK